MESNFSAFKLTYQVPERTSACLDAPQRRLCTLTIRWLQLVVAEVELLLTRGAAPPGGRASLKNTIGHARRNAIFHCQGRRCSRAS
jgi:hypothetical protein